MDKNINPLMLLAVACAVAALVVTVYAVLVKPCAVYGHVINLYGVEIRTDKEGYDNWVRAYEREENSTLAGGEGIREYGRAGWDFKSPRTVDSLASSNNTSGSGGWGGV